MVRGGTRGKLQGVLLEKSLISEWNPSPARRREEAMAEHALLRALFYNGWCASCILYVTNRCLSHLWISGGGIRHCVIIYNHSSLSRVNRTSLRSLRIQSLSNTPLIITCAKETAQLLRQDCWRPRKNAKEQLEMCYRIMHCISNFR